MLHYHNLTVTEDDGSAKDCEEQHAIEIQRRFSFLSQLLLELSLLLILLHFLLPLDLVCNEVYPCGEQLLKHLNVAINV